MSDNLGYQQLRDRLVKVNARDINQIIRILDGLSHEDSVLPQLISEYLGRLGFDHDGMQYKEGIELESPYFYHKGADAFKRVLRNHPIFHEERSLEAGIPMHEDIKNQFSSGMGGDVSKILVAGSLVINFLGEQDNSYLNALMHVIFNADAVSSLLRTILSAKPLPKIDDILEIPDDLRNLYKNQCLLGVEHALNDFGRAAGSNKATNWRTANITILQPNYGCAGDRVMIHGNGFGTSQPSRLEVRFPTVAGNCEKATTIFSWSDTDIEVEVPGNVGNGCVGFVELPSNPSPLTQAASSLAGEMEQCFGPGAFTAARIIRNLGNIGLIVPCPPCLPNGVNYFRGGPPQVDWFLINGSSELTVQPNTILNLTWQVRKSTTVRIRRTSTIGPFIDVINPSSQTINLGMFIGNIAVDATYELTATNGCGTIFSNITVRLRTDPVLSITAIEVVQTIQRPDNSVRLVAGKRTMVRVFVDSGITNGFNNGAGANLQPNVTGHVTTFRVGVGYGVDAGSPLNPGGVVTSQPAATINRNITIHSLNFEIPLSQLSGTVRIDAYVLVQGHENDVGGPWRAFSSTTVTFLAQPIQEVLPILIADFLLGLPAPTLAQYNTSLQGARTRYPIAQNGFIVNPSLMLSTFMATNLRDLTTVLGWGLLLTDIATMIFLFPSTPVGGIRTAIVPNDPRYAVNGMGVPRIALSIPAFIARAAQAGGSGLDPFAGTFAHEMGHCFGVTHAPCCTTSSDGIDGRLPGSTEDTGMDIPTRTVIRSGSGEIMSYCGDCSRCGGACPPPGPPRWPSIVFWDIIFGSLPI